jgi:dethiobiotin synthetase
MHRTRRIFISGIGTGIGKTVCSAILCDALGADYWKPIQAGDIENSDTRKVKSLVKNSNCCFHPESYQLPYPMSPHASANKAGIKIKTEEIIAPYTSNQNLIIEGAGGLMVPITDNKLYINLIKQFDAEVILVSKNYLGSINHTLLSIESLIHRNIPIKGIIFNGIENEETESVIIGMTGIKMLGRIPELNKINPTTISRIAKNFKDL